MAKSEEVSFLEFEKSEIEEYERTFRVPPASVLFHNISLLPAGQQEYKFDNLRFTTGGVLANLDHYWELKIQPNQTVAISLRVKYYNDKRFLYQLHRSNIYLYGNGELVHESQLIFTQSKKELQYEDHVWTVTKALYGTRTQWWNDRVDSLKVVLRFQCATVGRCVNSLTFNTTTDGLGAGKHLKTNDFFLNDFLSDVKLVCGGETFPAHRFVLSSNSPVFERMFQVEMKETNEGRVEIKDVDSGTLKEVLRFIYTDEFSSSQISQEGWVDLYKVAHKYEMEDLKLKCRNQILQKISPENAIQVLIFADLYNEEGLKLKALEFIKRDKVKMMKDPKTFTEFANAYPQLAFDLLRP